MDEKNQDSKKGGCSKENGGCGNKRFASTTTEDSVGGECSGKYCCRSCTAGLIADCVALCCCPCAVLHCFALAFVKAPWFVGKRCFGLRNKNKNKNKCNKKRQELDDVNVVLERNNNNKDGGLKMGWSDSSSAPMQQNDGFEAEKVWLELYQIGHLDFGRVSFSGGSKKVDSQFSIVYVTVTVFPCFSKLFIGALIRQNPAKSLGIEL